MRKTVHEPVAHLVKRVDMDRKKAWLIRLIAFALSILACAIITTAITKKDMGFFFKNFFGGAFSTPRRVWGLFHGHRLHGYVRGHGFRPGLVQGALRHPVLPDWSAPALGFR